MNRILQKQAVMELSTLRDVIRFGASCFNEAGIYYGHGTDNAWDEALAIALYCIHLHHSYGAKILEAKLTSFERQQIIDLYHQRIIKRIPVPYLTHEAWFCGMAFYVDERVLIPRSPIAELIEQQFQPWINADAVTNILDIGTGSACIAIAAAHYFPQAHVDAIDIADDALKVAAINIKQHHFEKQITLIKSDLFAALEKKQYDIIIANPPYVDASDMQALPQEYTHEPEKALAAGDDGLDLAKIILAKAYDYLSDDGILILEVGNSAAALEQQYPDTAFLWIEFEKGGEGVCLLTRDQCRVLYVRQ